MTSTESAKTIPSLLQAAGKELGSQTAMRYKKYGLWHDISWQEYAGSVRTAASALIELGLNKGDCVTIIGDNCPEWVIFDLAIQSAGGVSVGIYATSSPEQCEYVINHAQARFHFVENEEQLDKWLQIREKTPSLQKIIVLDETGLLEFDHEMVMSWNELMELGESVQKRHAGELQQRLHSLQPDDLAMLIYTSGTTGPPKGAMLSHGNMVSMAEAVHAANPVMPTDEVLSFLPLCHIFERLFSVIIHIRHHYTVNFIENTDTVTENMREVSPVVGYAVPRVWEKYYSYITIEMSRATWFKRTCFALARRAGEAYVQEKMQDKKPAAGVRIAYGLAELLVFRKLRERLGFDRMRIAYSGAAPVSPSVLLFFQSIGLNLIEGYGQTESCGVTTTNRTDSFRLRTVGKPVPGTEVRIAEDGEILVRSESVFKGYYNNPQATEETLIDGWLHTGDVGEFDEEGNLRIIDRKKDIIITAGGKNIAPQYIENKLKFSLYINDAIVIGDRRKYLTAIIVLDEENTVNYAQENKIQFSTYRDLANNEKIHELIAAEVEAVNRELARVEQIRKFRILPKRLYEEDGEVTPTMKVKRQRINTLFADLIAEMYGE